MTFTLGQAAKQAGVSKPTLARWIHRGRISADKNDDGSYLIDASELDRIAELKQLARNRASHGDPTMQPMDTPDDPRMLQQEIVFLRERLVEKDHLLEELRQERQQERREKERLLCLLERHTLVLPTTQEEVPAPKKPWWKRMFS
jgi:excisionase family DNA binding protein